LKEPHAPEAAAARNCVGVTILFKLLGIYILAWEEVTVGAVWIFVKEDLVTKRSVRFIVPDVQYSFSRKVTENLRTYVFIWRLDSG